MSTARRTFWGPALGALTAVAVAVGLMVGLGLFSEREYGYDAPDAEPLPPMREVDAEIAAEAATPAQSESGDAFAIKHALRASALRVSFVLRYDSGEAPRSLSVNDRYSSSLEQAVIQNRCPARGGWLLTERKVFVPDIQVHPRFLKHIIVSLPGQPTAYAHIVAYLKDVDGVILELDRRLPSARPLEFSAAPGPFYAVSYRQDECRWGLYIRRTLDRFQFFDNGLAVAQVGAKSLIVGANGTPIGISTMSEVPLEGTWRTSPLEWPQLTAAEYTNARVDLFAKVQVGLPRVHLRFRSPKKDVAESSLPAYLRDDDEMQKLTEFDATGVLIDERRLLVLADLKPEVTARLEAIEVHLGDGKVIQAEHRYSLKDYGAFLADAQEPVRGALVRAEVQPEALLDRLLMTASVVQRAERCVLRFAHVRVRELTRGLGGLVVPDLPADVEDHYLFLPDARLVALALPCRDQEGRPRWRDSEAVMLPTVHLREILRSPASHSDLANKPRPAEGERRLAWLGVELQLLDHKLARANDVAHLTEDGEVGALVSYVYADAPAAQIGLRPGDILIRLHVEGEPKPLDVCGTRQDRREYEDWLDEYDDVPSSLRGRYPDRPPWPSVESKLNRDLTTVGIGRAFTVEYVADGVVQRKGLVVAEGPPHFEAAPHCESSELGLTVRDLTYEVRRHYQFDKDAPGVVVAEVEGGRPADVAGVVPYEVISEVDGNPIHDVAAFEAATTSKGETRLTIRGTAQERVVKLRAP